LADLSPAAPVLTGATELPRRPGPAAQLSADAWPIAGVILTQESSMSRSQKRKALLTDGLLRPFVVFVKIVIGSLVVIFIFEIIFSP
jgi:hypothetical protein